MSYRKFFNDVAFHKSKAASKRHGRTEDFKSLYSDKLVRSVMKPELPTALVAHARSKAQAAPSPSSPTSVQTGASNPISYTSAA